MEPNPTFLKSLEFHSKRNLAPKSEESTRPSQSSRIRSSTLTTSLSNLIQEKHNLELTHNKIVRKVPISSSQNPSKPLNRTQEFIRKKIHYINCPVVQYPESPRIEKDSPVEEKKSFDADLDDLSFLTRKVPALNHTFQTSIFYAEDLFGNKRNEKERGAGRPLRKLIKSNFNNLYTRRIAGSSEIRMKKRSEELVSDALGDLEARLPSRMRTGQNFFPWAYSSVGRTNTIFKVKCKSRGS